MRCRHPGRRPVDIVERAHPDLGKLGVFWHTQGSGKSYSMAFFAEKVRRIVPGNFTFLLMTDRDDLDDQIYRTFVGCGVADEKTPRAGSGKELEHLLQGESPLRLQPDPQVQPGREPDEPYSERDDIIVISDEAHRTQAGKLARNMRLALPNASFIGFTGTPLFKHDELTKRIFGDYVSRYDFKRSEEDGATVKLVYENRGEKLGIARLDLNDRIADDDRGGRPRPGPGGPAGEAARQGLRGHHRRRPAGQAGRRLRRALLHPLGDAASRCWCASTRSPARGCSSASSRAGRPRLAQLRAGCRGQAGGARRRHGRRTRGSGCRPSSIACAARRSGWRAPSSRSSSARRRTRSRDFKKWGFDIIPHRAVMKTGLRDAGRQAGGRGDAFKNPEHPFRVAIVCAMWLTGFDVECLSTLYIDKPMKAHTLMQAIARANRVYPGQGLRRDRGLQRHAQEPARGAGAVRPGRRRRWRRGDIVAPIEERVQALLEAIEATENHLRGLGFEMQTGCIGATGLRPHRGPARRGGCGLHLATRPSAASRSWPGRCSSASRRC